MPADDKDIVIRPGDLNKVSPKKFKRVMTGDPARGVNAARVSAVRSLYETDLDLTGRFRGIIISNEIGENYDSQSSWVGSIVDDLADAFLDQIKYYKVRVPVVHAHLPDPWSESLSDNECSVFLHPTFETIEDEDYAIGDVVEVSFYSSDGLWQPSIHGRIGNKVFPPPKPIAGPREQSLEKDRSLVNPVLGDSIGTGAKLPPISKVPEVSEDSDKRGWRSKFGGAKWRIDLDGIEFKDDGRPYASESSVERLWKDYGSIILRASEAFQVPVDMIVAMIPIEALNKNGRYAPDSVGFEPVRSSDQTRAEKHWRSYDGTREADRGRYLPHRVSPGLMQTLVTTARKVVKDYQQIFRVKPHEITSPVRSAYTRSDNKREGFVFSDRLDTIAAREGVSATPAQTTPKFSTVNIPADEPPEGYGDNTGLRSWTVRSDIEPVVREIKKIVNDFGGILTSAGGFRSLNANVGSSRSATSVHYSALAIDLATPQGMKNPHKDPYVITPDPTQEGLWVVYARVEKGSDVVIDNAVVHSGGEISTIPVTGKFINLTRIFKDRGFARIPARSGFPQDYKAAEWWHFEKTDTFVKGQTTFGDILSSIHSLSDLEGSEPWQYRNYVWNGTRFSGEQKKIPKSPLISLGSTLFRPDLSIFVGAGYIRKQIIKYGPDPILIVGAYNAGTVRPGDGNKWKIQTYGASRIPKFASYYNTFHKLVQDGTITLPSGARLSTVPVNQDITGVAVDITDE